MYFLIIIENSYQVLGFIVINVIIVKFSRL